MYQTLTHHLAKVGHLFYLVDPRTTYKSNAKDVPAYVNEAIPYFAFVLLLEQLIIFYRGFKLIKINDAITSAAQGILMEQTKLLFPTFNLVFYTFIWNKYHLIDLPWNSLFTWIVALILIDFGFYWFHRACHEVNFLWATHQVHHSSEHFNLSTALRQSIPQLYFHTLFYLPLALVLPPSVYLIHFEFNTLFQFWIHTEIVDSCGFLGYIINTPSYHRVHHGRNRYCIDKNYASVLIIWDKMFGTFQAEDKIKEKPIAYGLTHPIRTFDPLKIQFSHYANLLSRVKSTPGWRGKLSVLFKGPGWEPGKPRLGLIEDIPKITGQEEVFDPPNTLYAQIYSGFHFILILILHVNCASFAISKSTSNYLTTVTLLFNFSFILLSFTSFASLMEGKLFSSFIEFGRCLIFILLQKYILLFNGPKKSFQLTSIDQLTDWSIAMNALIKLIYFTSMMYHLFNLIHLIQEFYLLHLKSQLQREKRKSQLVTKFKLDHQKDL